MAALTKFYCFTEDLAEKVHNLGADTLKIMLSNVAPSLSNTIPSNITEITPGNGYTAGGATVTITSSTQTAGAYKLILGDVTITAAGGSIGPFRYVVLYNSTATKLIGYADYGISYTLPDGQPFVVDFDGTAGAITLT